MRSAPPPSRCLGELTFVELRARLRESSILCLPMGALEQHGRHLPLNTDAVIAEEVSRRIVARWGEQFDVWLLPTIFLGLSREHDWAPGTLSLGIESFVALTKELAREMVRSLAARNLLIVNAHGGNRGVLETLMHDLYAELRLNTCAIHPFDLWEAGSSSLASDVHAGKHETSVMLAIAPDLVRRSLIARAGKAPDAARVRSMIFDRGVSFPWRTDDARLATLGVIGDPRGASAALGHAIMESVVTRTGAVLARLVESGRSARGAREQQQARLRESPARTSRRNGSRRQRRARKSS